MRRYSNEDFLKKIQESMQDMLSHNAQVWQACVLGPNRNVCSLSSFLEQSCHRFPAMTMKMVRLRLNLTRELLVDDPSVKVLYLVRDPRATMNSRLSSVKWCSQSVDCIDPARLCADMPSSRFRPIIRTGWRSSSTKRWPSFLTPRSAPSLTLPASFTRNASAKKWSDTRRGTRTIRGARYANRPSAWISGGKSSTGRASPKFSPSALT